ncbi:MAG: ABC transporter substrate-binding protein [Thermocrispum sp.]
MRTERRRTLLLATVAATAAALLSACGSSGTSAEGRTQITVGCMPPKSDEITHANFAEDIAAFEKANPDIDVVGKPTSTCQDPQTFEAKLAGGQMEDVFYAYFTDIKHVIDVGRAADITEQAEKAGALDGVKDTILPHLKGEDGRIYALPRTNYATGLVYNRSLFRKAGLDPDKPPTTWEQVRSYADKIAALGDGVVGYADYSAKNQGGWHFAMEVFAHGGQMVTQNGKQAAFDDTHGEQVLQVLHDMRWQDDSMGSKQLLTIPDVQQKMAAGKVGMYLGAPDNIIAIVDNYGGSYKTYGLGPMPGEGAALAGGDVYLFHPESTPEQIEAGVKWLMFQQLTPGKGQFDYERAHAKNQAVGIPQPDLLTGEKAAEVAKLRKKYGTVPAQNVSPFVEAMQSKELAFEPPQAQKIYSVLDGVMSTVLTKRDANIDQLLSDAADKVDGILGGP